MGGQPTPSNGRRVPSASQLSTPSSRLRPCGTVRVQYRYGLTTRYVISPYGTVPHNTLNSNPTTDSPQTTGTGTRTVLLLYGFTRLLVLYLYSTRRAYLSGYDSTSTILQVRRKVRVRLQYSTILYFAVPPPHY